MVIWILDCATCYCTKVKLSEERQKELDEVFENDVESFLSKYEDEFGIKTAYSSWMVANDDCFEEIDF